MRQCTRETCFVPETGCDLGHTDLSHCPAWCRQVETLSDHPAQTDNVLLPWSGSALGLADIGFVSGSARPVVVGVVGPQNAGKSTLLGSWYLLLGRGAIQLSDREFAGSYSLAGWEAVSGSMRWEPGQAPGFPPHTSSRNGRAPGMLHLSFWNASEIKTTDYLFADAPGEWFQKWAVNLDAPEGAGARWIADRADIFLIVADRAALSGENMGSARNSLKLLARRLASERRTQPVALVWTKADVVIPLEIENSVREAVMSNMPDAAEFSVSVMSDDGGSGGSGKGMVELLKWALAKRRSQLSLPSPTSGRDDPLFLYGTRSK